MAEAGVGERLAELRIDRTRRTARSRVRRRLLPAILALLVLAVAILVLATRAPAVEVVQVREARPGEAVTELSASGYVASTRRSIIAPQIPGRLDEVLVDEGQQVQEGEIIARLDDADARVALLRSQAEESAARGRVEEARALVARSRRDLARTEQLTRSGALAGKALPDARNTFEAAEAQLASARAQHEASLRAVEAANLQLSHTTVRAPFTGTVVRKIADEGAVLAPAAITTSDVGGIVELVDLQGLEVEAEVSEEQLRRIERGQPALIFLDAYPDRVFRGEAGTVRPAIDRSKATAVVKVQFTEPTEGVLPDMGAKISFLGEPLPDEALQSDARLRVPAAAVVERDGRQVVFVVEDGRARAVPVQVGERVDDEVSLVEGPKPGTPVIRSPGDLREGSRVKVQEAS